MTKLSELAYKAAEILAEHGHCKFRTQNVYGEHCLIGALYAAETELTEADYTKSLRVIERMSDHVREEGLPMSDGPDEIGKSFAVRWNNAASTTGEDVILALKQTGHDFEQEGK
jgi:hypothetical protein